MVKFFNPWILYLYFTVLTCMAKSNDWWLVSFDYYFIIRTGPSETTFNYVLYILANYYFIKQDGG